MSTVSVTDLCLLSHDYPVVQVCVLVTPCCREELLWGFHGKLTPHILYMYMYIYMYMYMYMYIYMYMYM